MEISSNGTYTTEFKENLVIMKKKHTSQEIASYLNSICGKTVSGKPFKTYNIDGIIHNYREKMKKLEREEEVMSNDTSPVEPSLTIYELMNHPKYDHILGRLNSIRSAEKQIAKLERIQVQSYEMLNKLVTEEK